MTVAPQKGEGTEAPQKEEVTGAPQKGEVTGAPPEGGRDWQPTSPAEGGGDWQPSVPQEGEGSLLGISGATISWSWHQPKVCLWGDLGWSWLY